MMEVQQEEGMMESQIQTPQQSQLNHQINNQQHHHSYNNNQFVQTQQMGQGEYQYLPGQHWLAGPSEQNYSNSLSMNGFGFGNQQFGGYTHLQSQNSGGINALSSTIHHTGPQQLQQQQQSSSMSMSNCHQGPTSSPSMYSTGIQNSCLSINCRNMQPSSSSLLSTFASCTNYQHSHHGPTTAFPNLGCHYHPPGGGQFVGGGTSSSSSSTTMTTMKNKMKTTTTRARKVATFSSSSLASIGSHNSLFSHIGNPSWASAGTEMVPLPGGIEVVWRQVPVACQKLITMQDVPDTAKLRGYFTVCELLNLKRTLLSRLNSMETEQHDETIPREEQSVGVVVKQAMNTLDGDRSPDSELQIDEDNKPNKSPIVVDKSSSSLQEEPNKQEVRNDGGGENIISADIEILPCTTSPPTSPTPSSSSEITTSSAIKSHCSTTDSLINRSSTSSSSTTTTLGNQDDSKQTSQFHSPAYRTATLVFKLLEIGNYQIRSYSEMNPNRFRVLFNTQRITYECHLTLVQGRDAIHGNVRKLLTIDIGFDQISMLRFGCNKLLIKVDGSPLLSVSFYPAEMDHTCPPLTEQDHNLLKQVESGQLKLSAYHEIHFINERLVHLLEAQFKQHPHFRQIMQHTYKQNPMKNNTSTC